MDSLTFEVFKSTKEQRNKLAKSLISDTAMMTDYIGDDYHNITVDIYDEETLTEWAEQNNLDFRSV